MVNCLFIRYGDPWAHEVTQAHIDFELLLGVKVKSKVALFDKLYCKGPEN